MAIQPVGAAGAASSSPIQPPRREREVPDHSGETRGPEAREEAREAIRERRVAGDEARAREEARGQRLDVRA